MSTQTILDELHFVEALPFASRLHVLQAMVRGACDVALKVVVHVPPRAEGDDMNAFRAQLPSTVTVSVDESLPEAKTRAYARFGSVTRLFSTANRDAARVARAAVVMTAIDDYPKAIPMVALRAARSSHQLYFVRYRVDDLVSKRGWRRLVKRLYFGAFTRIARAHTIVFDERLAGRDNVYLLPDPWSGPFRPRDKAAARRGLGLSASAPVVLLVGFQDMRKGFPDAAGIVLSAVRSAPLQLAIVGGVDPTYRDELTELRAVLGDNLFHIDRYIADELLARYIASADAVLLPYASSFTSTSGVLVRAAACNVPVLATSTGLVGWRVRAHKLGLVFPSGNVRDGVSKLLQLLANPALAHGGTDFAAASTEEVAAGAFAGIVRTVWND